MENASVADKPTQLLKAEFSVRRLVDTGKFVLALRYPSGVEHHADEEFETLEQAVHAYEQTLPQVISDLSQKFTVLYN